MEKKIIDAVTSQVHHRFPEMAGCNPKIQTQSTALVKSATANYLLIYEKACRGADGKTINRIVRVVIDEKGKILKLTTSR
jgi:hypothetical protein